MFLKLESKCGGAIEESRLYQVDQTWIEIYLNFVCRALCQPDRLKKMSTNIYYHEKERNLPCRPYRLPIARDIHIHHFPLMPEHDRRILLQHRAGTKLFVQRQLFLALHDDAIADR
jgi:hypothetical protein